MKQGLIALSGLAWLRLATAACCRSNQCLKGNDCFSPMKAGLAGCSLRLAITVTPSASTITETVTVVPTLSDAIIVPVTYTETTTTTAATATHILTVSSTIAAFTQADRIMTIQTVVVTETALRTVTTTARDTVGSQAPLKARTDTELPPSIPDYASAACPSWERYVAACKCAGVSATTIMAEASAATTITEQVTSTATVPVDSTVTSTETEVVSVTTTTSLT
ncbi:hypothetical protein MFIFM68171_04720 [Madurella fahalii]|uniref:Uncharacterized protein n=1 Tax=Madurella fahalii TaxID=1157608 RepID=A0ABQ0G9S4_9PEZI